jgi:hypothetical protein
MHVLVVNRECLRLQLREVLDVPHKKEHEIRAALGHGEKGLGELAALDKGL